MRGHHHDWAWATAQDPGEGIVGPFLCLEVKMRLAREDDHVATLRFVQDAVGGIADVLEDIGRHAGRSAARAEVGQESRDALVRVGDASLVPRLLVGASAEGHRLALVDRGLVEHAQAEQASAEASRPVEGECGGGLAVGGSIQSDEYRAQHGRQRPSWPRRWPAHVATSIPVPPQ